MVVIVILTALVYAISAKYDESIKYILIWSPQQHIPLPSLGKGYEAFTNCKNEARNCFVTSDRKYFEKLTNFDAIAFSGKMLENQDIPSERAPHQIYIFFSSEPTTSQHPICNAAFDGFFNWTATYKLNSDIPWTYFDIEEIKSHTIIGPQSNMHWKKSSRSISSAFRKKIITKTKAVAWFSSQFCTTLSERENHAFDLQVQLRELNLKMDVYGGCGTMACHNGQDCLKKLEAEYFFYLAMEPILDVDYVTQELLLALKHNVVPIVYGGADYTKFLPPDSYLNAKEDPKILAHKIRRLIRYPKLYEEYFRWRRLYAYKSPKNVCRLCAALHNKASMNQMSSYQDFRSWWDSHFQDHCKWYNFTTQVKSVFG